LSIYIAHHREYAHTSNALSSLIRAACRTATVCSLQTQAIQTQLGNQVKFYNSLVQLSCLFSSTDGPYVKRGPYWNLTSGNWKHFT